MCCSNQKFEFDFHLRKFQMNAIRWGPMKKEERNATQFLIVWNFIHDFIGVRTKGGPSERGVKVGSKTNFQRKWLLVWRCIAISNAHVVIVIFSFYLISFFFSNAINQFKRNPNFCACQIPASNYVNIAQG